MYQSFLILFQQVTPLILKLIKSNLNICSNNKRKDFVFKSFKMIRLRSINLKKQIKAIFSNQIQPIRTISSDEVIQRELKYGAHNYDTVPVALCRGKGKF